MTDPILYRLSFPDFKSHRLSIEAHISAEPMSESWQARAGLGRSSQEPLVLFMPTWTPGSYLVREYARHVESIVASDAITGKNLSMRKISKNQWLLSPQAASQIKLEYVLYCRELSVRTNWIDEEFALLNGAATFITRDDALEHPHIVEIEPASSWPQLACSLLESFDERSFRKKPWQLRASSFHELVDSPILMGTFDTATFQVGGRPHYLINLSSDKAWDIKQVAEDCEKIVRCEQDFWGGIPYTKYWFLNLPLEGYGGLEHDNNTLLLTHRFASQKRTSYVEWLGLVSHEFFHTWNVRRLRPKSLIQYDYHGEQYTEELWIAEGVTSYFDDLLVLRAGLITPDEYLGLLSKTYQQVEETPGKLVQSLRDASWDTWIKHYRPDENSANSRISYYTKGAIVAFLLDVEIMKRSQGRQSLREVMRQLWEGFQSQGYTLADFEQIVTQTCDCEMRPWFEQNVYQAEPLDYQSAFDWLGLENAVVTTDEINQPISKAIDLGCDVANREGRWVVTRVLRNSAANHAGLQVDDELIAVNGWRLSKENWRDRLLQANGQTFSMIISRRHKLREIVIQSRARQAFGLKFVHHATSEQRINRRRWLYWGVDSFPASPHLD